MKQVANPVNKGEVIAVKMSRTASFVHGSRPAETMVTYALAKVASATRTGIAVKVTFAGMPHAGPIEPRDVLTIKGDFQSPAVQLYASIAYPGREWATADELKDAVRAVMDAWREPKKHAFPWES